MYQADLLRYSYSEIECPDPVSPKSGYIEVSNFKGRYQFGSVATYRCNHGFILSGNASRYYDSCKTGHLCQYLDIAQLMDPGMEVLHLVITEDAEILRQWQTV